MLEGIDRSGRRALLERQPRLGELRQRLVQRRLWVRSDGGDQLVGELAPDRRTDLRDLLDRRKAIEPGHQQVAEGRRDRQAAGMPGIFPAVDCLNEVAGFEDRPGQFLDEERHAVGLAEDLVDEVSR